MRELIEIKKERGQRCVSARELYEFLEVVTPFSIWIKRMFDYGFREGKDYVTFLLDRSDGKPGKRKTDYTLTLDTAKEISMIQRNDKGRQARQYFIDVEKMYKEASARIFEDPIVMLRLNQKQILKELDQVNNRIKTINRRLGLKKDYYTIVGYAALFGVTLKLKLAAEYGRKAKKYCDDNNLKTDSIPDARFGLVRMYPEKALEAVFNKK